LECASGGLWAQAKVKNGNLLEIAAYQEDHEMVRTLINCHARCNADMNEDLAPLSHMLFERKTLATLKTILSYWLQVEDTRANQGKCRSN
jgi:hypothetical protein